MNAKRHWLFAVISGLISAGLVCCIYFLQVQQMAWQETVRVIVPKHLLDAGTMLSSDMLTYKTISVIDFDERMFTDQEAVIGQETLIPLGEGEPILSWKLNQFNLFPRHGQNTFQIPKAYILSVSNQIRAGDLVNIYISSADGSPRKLFEEPSTVAAVKLSSNQEVEDDMHSSLLSRARGDLERLYVSRRHATGPIDTINLNLTEQQWLEIDRLCAVEGYKLVIAFSNARMDQAATAAKEGFP